MKSVCTKKLFGGALALSILSFGGVAHAQWTPQLPADPGYPKAIAWPEDQRFPMVWNNGGDQCKYPRISRSSFTTPLNPDGAAHEDPTGIDWQMPLLSYQYPGTAWNRAGTHDLDIHGDWVVMGFGAWGTPADPWLVEQNVFSYNLDTGAIVDVSGMMDGIFDGRPAVGDYLVVWQTGHSKSNGIGWAELGHHNPQYIYVGKDYYHSWPNVWKDYVVFNEVKANIDHGIGMYELGSGAHHSLLDDPNKALRRAPHIHDGRLVYEVVLSPTYTTIRHMDVWSWGNEVDPYFLNQLGCNSVWGPRVGGPEGRYILFTGEDCKYKPGITYGLYLGDTKSNKAYFIDALDDRPHVEDHRPPYDIFNDMVVYEKRNKTWWGGDLGVDVMYYDFDENQL